MQNLKGETIFSWEAYEYPDREVKADWFWALGIIALAGSVASFIWGNFLFGVFIIFASAALIFFATVKPKLVRYEITTGGIVYEGNFYPFETLHAFWMDESESDNKKLLVKSERFLVPILTLPYSTEEEGDAIYEAISDIIEEEPLQEPWGHIIMERLGF
jgi:hypothetical protein